MRQTLFTKISASLLAIIYMVAVFGFDIHQCGDTDHVFIGPLFSGIGCEDIHPDVECHHHCHCYHMDSACHEEGDCCLPEDDCTDSVKCLSITGEDLQPLSVAPALASAAFRSSIDCVCDIAVMARTSMISAKDPPREYLRKLDILRV